MIAVFLLKREKPTFSCRPTIVRLDVRLSSDYRPTMVSAKVWFLEERRWMYILLYVFCVPGSHDNASMHRTSFSSPMSDHDSWLTVRIELPLKATTPPPNPGQNLT